VDGSSGNIGLHVDGNSRETGNYDIPGKANLSDPASADGKLPSSFTRSNSLAAGASLIQSWGYLGAAVQTLNDHYGIPTAEKSFIDLRQNRLDLEGQLNSPLKGFDSLKFKLSGTDYQHTEKAEDGTRSQTLKTKCWKAASSCRTRTGPAGKAVGAADGTDQILSIVGCKWPR
jgi:iron complex outermembrane receptor protein